MLEQFIVGIVRGPHGVTGEFKVESTSGDYEHFARIKEVTLTNGDISRKCRVESVREGNNTLLMKCSGIDSPEEAKKLNKWEIVVPREFAHPLEENEWYIEDLKGCSVFYEDGLANGNAPVTISEENVIGTITDVMEGGSGDLIEISLSESCKLLAGKTGRRFVPFNKEFFKTIDVENRRLGLMHLWILE